MIWLKPAPPVNKPVLPPTAAAQPRRAAPEPVRVAPPVQAPPIAIEKAEPAAPTPPALPSAEQIMSIARRDLGKIDKDLRKEQRRQEFSAPVDSPQARLSRGMQEAHDAVPPKWYQAAKVEDFTPPGDDARKVYRITTATGSYCVFYADKNKMQSGAANLGEAKMGKCPTMF